MLDAGIEVPLVVTRPDRPSGRHSAPQASAVGRLAAERGIPAAKPQRLAGNEELFRQISDARPDAGVVVAYGRLLPNALLEAPPLGFVNVHASLLPRHRGASPVQAALLAGDVGTGVSTMRVVEDLDAGPVYLSRRVAIGQREDAGSLSERLAAEGAELLVETLRGLEAGTLLASPQAGTPSFCKPIRRQDGEVDWTLPAETIERRLRAYTPWPGLYTFLGGERVKILAARVGIPARDREPGDFWLEKDELLAAAGGGTTLVLERVQREGRTASSGAEFARGARPPGRFGRASAG